MKKGECEVYEAYYVYK